MPLKIVDPRQGRSKNYRIRGTYLRVRIDRSAGTSDRALARQILQKIKRDIERGALSDRQGPTFASAATAYMRNGGERRFLPPLLQHFGERPLEEIDQAAIDEAAATLYPDASPATRNRQVYTPVSSILKHAGVETGLHRPHGSEGQKRIRWLWPEEAERIVKAAEAVDPEFASFLVLLLYTGLRLSEALSLECRNLHLADRFAYLPDSKNDEPRAVFLPPAVVADLAGLPLDSRRRVFRFRKNGYLYTLLKRTKEAAGPDLSWVGFHAFCHTWATWMRRFAGLDTKGLVATGRWKDRKSADRYEHVVVSEEARRAVLLPTLRREK